jgi:hypothetical protein
VNESLTFLIPVLVLAMLVLFRFVGCVGEDPDHAYGRGQQDEATKQDEQHQQEQATQKELAKYTTVVGTEPDLISYWRLSEGESGGTTAKDSAPDNPKDGTYQNAAGGGVLRDVPGALAPINDPADKASEFDGTRGFVEVPHDVLLNPPLEFSIEFWLRPTGSPADRQVVVGSYEVNPAGDLVRGFAVDIMPGAPLSIRVRIGKGDGFTSLDASLGDGSEHDGWRHVVATYSASLRSLKLYVNADNGAPDAELPTPASPLPVFYVQNQVNPLRIAAGQVEGPAPATTPALFFKGRVDEVALYRVPLDGQKVKNHFLHAISLTA